MRSKKILSVCAIFLIVFVFVVAGHLIVFFQSPVARLFYEITKRDKDGELGHCYNRTLLDRFTFPFFFFYGPDDYFNAEVIPLHFLDLTGFDFSNLRGLRDEFSLDLRHSNVTDEQLKTICQFENINHLDLTGCTRVTSEGFREIANLKKLNMLYLTATTVTDDDVRLLKDMPNLGVLMLRGTHIDGSAFNTEDGWKKLRVLNLQGCELSDDLFDSLPNIPLYSLTFSINDDNRLPPNIENLVASTSLRDITILGKNLQDESDEGLPVDILEKLRKSFKVRVFRQPERIY